jgi:uncharacterized pyridoxamine 5'-phosphate oxidase family protein
VVYGLTHKQLNLLEDNIVANVAIIHEGRPLMFPVWCVLHDGRIFFSTKSDHEKYRYLLENPDPVVGLSIIHPKGSLYLSLTGNVEVRDRDEFTLFDNVMERIVRKYVQDQEKAKEFLHQLKSDSSRRLIQITPH